MKNKDIARVVQEENKEKDEIIALLEKRITNLEIAHATLTGALQDEVSFEKASFLDSHIEQMHRASESVGGFRTTQFQGLEDARIEGLGSDITGR